VVEWIIEFDGGLNGGLDNDEGLLVSITAFDFVFLSGRFSSVVLSW